MKTKMITFPVSVEVDKIKIPDYEFITGTIKRAIKGVTDQSKNLGLVPSELFELSIESKDGFDFALPRYKSTFKIVLNIADSYNPTTLKTQLAIAINGSLKQLDGVKLKNELGQEIPAILPENIEVKDVDLQRPR
jgi:hypothetical protein